MLRDGPIEFRRLTFTGAEPLRRARFPIKASDHSRAERPRSTLGRCSGIHPDKYLSSHSSLWNTPGPY